LALVLVSLKCIVFEGNNGRISMPVFLPAAGVVQVPLLPARAGVPLPLST
jgi:hypothetical protein